MPIHFTAPLAMSRFSNSLPVHQGVGYTATSEADLHYFWLIPSVLPITLQNCKAYILGLCAVSFNPKHLSLSCKYLLDNHTITINLLIQLQTSKSNGSQRQR
jgi:hypothetical protein